MYWTHDKKKLSHVNAAVSIHLSFITCSILGNYARIGVTKLSNYESSYISSGSVVWPNFTASLIMGTLQVLNLPAHSWFIENPSLFMSLTTGFCGSFSSYSTMMIESFLFAASLNKSNIETNTKLPNRAYGIMEFLSVIFANLFISMGGYIFGRFLASDIIVYYLDSSNSSGNLENYDKTDNLNNDIITQNSIKHNRILIFIAFINNLFVILAIPLLILIIVLSAVYDNYSRSSWTLSAIFTIFGSFSRFYLSNWFNSHWINFPLGTFLANQFAVLIYSFLLIVQRGKKFSSLDPILNNQNGCRIISSLITGFCGGLSTISTFINEAYKLPFRNMIFYYFTSIAISIIICIITVGSFAWSRGFTQPIC